MFFTNGQLIAPIVAAGGVAIATFSSSSFADDTLSSAPFAPTAAESANAPIPSAAAALGVASGHQPSTGMAVDGWMVYPTLFVGAIYNSNVYQSSNGTPAAGLQVVPYLEADFDSGIHKTTLFLNADGQMYPGQSARMGSKASTLSGQTGLVHLWQPTNDISVTILLNYARQDTPFASGLVTNSTIGSATSFVNSGMAPNVSGYQQFSDTVTGAVTVEKLFTEQIFARTGVGAQYLTYEAPPMGYVAPFGGWDYNAFLRGGFWVTPQVNAFVEVGGDLRRYQTPWYNTNSYRMIGGLSTSMIGLFRGEVYGGVQTQDSSNGDFGSVTAPAYGASLYYYPLRYLTLGWTLSNAFGSAATPGVGAQGTAVATPNNQTVQALFEADYSLASSWTASVRAGYAQTKYSNSSFVNGAWTFGVGINYSIWKNYSITFNDELTRATANHTGNTTYSQNVTTIGVTYRY